jgi:hypothetical protein
LLHNVGVGFDSIHHFRTTFKENLRLALAVYRDARLEVTERGVDLHQSRPPVSPKVIASGKVPTIANLRSNRQDSGKDLGYVPQLVLPQPDVVISLRGRKR